MDQLLTNNVWKQVAEHLKRGGPKIAAIAYVTDGSHLRFKKGDVLVCDASDATIKSGGTNPSLLKSYLKAGAELYSCPGLHAKVLVTGDRAVVGSANLSSSSAENLIELSLFTSRTQIRSQVRAFVQKLILRSSRIDAAFIAHARKLPVAIKSEGKNVQRGNIEQPTNRYWFVSTVPLSEKLIEKESEFEKAGSKMAKSRMSDPENSFDWIRWCGRSAFRANANEGDVVIELSCNNKERTRCTVNPPRSIVLRQVHDRWTRFYMEDSPEENGFRWSAFLAEINKLGLKGISKRTTRELKPKEIAAMNFIWREDGA